MSTDARPDFGFVRVAAAVPPLRVADIDFNLQQILDFARRADAEGAQVVVFPELSLTSYTAGDLFHQHLLLDRAADALLALADASSSHPARFSSSASRSRPRATCSTPRRSSARAAFTAWCRRPTSPATRSTTRSGGSPRLATWWRPRSELGDRVVPVGSDLLFRARGSGDLVIGVEICEDLWGPLPPSSFQALHGAHLDRQPVGLERTGREGRLPPLAGRAAVGPRHLRLRLRVVRRRRVEPGRGLRRARDGGRERRRSSASRAGSRARATCSSPTWTSSTCGSTGSGPPASATRSTRSRRWTGGSWTSTCRPTPGMPLRRALDPAPFIPRDDAERNRRTEEILSIQTAGLVKRLSHAGIERLVIGLSGGLDSTLALLVAVRAFDATRPAARRHPRRHDARLRHQLAHAVERRAPGRARAASRSRRSTSPTGASSSSATSATTARCRTSRSRTSRRATGR